MLARKLIALVGTSLIVGSVSTAAFAVSKHTAGVARTDVRQLLRLMDRDQNGAVSKDEFMQFMSQTFDRLDVNRSGQLEPSELRTLTVPNWAPMMQGGQ